MFYVDFDILIFIVLTYESFFKLGSHVQRKAYLHVRASGGLKKALFQPCMAMIMPENAVTKQ